MDQNITSHRQGNTRNQFDPLKNKHSIYANVYSTPIYSHLYSSFALLLLSSHLSILFVPPVLPSVKFSILCVCPPFLPSSHHSFFPPSQEKGNCHTVSTASSRLQFQDRGVTSSQKLSCGQKAHIEIDS